MSVSTEAAEMLLMQTVLDWLHDNEMSSPWGPPHPGFDKRCPTTTHTICDTSRRTSKDVKEAVLDLLSQFPPMRLHIIQRFGFYKGKESKQEKGKNSGPSSLEIFR